MPDRSMADTAILNAPLESSRRGFTFFKTDTARGRLRAWIQPVTFLGLAMLAAIYCILTFLIVGGRQEAETSARRQGENLVRIIDESYSHIFHSVDSVLMILRKASRLTPSSFDMSDWVGDVPIRNNLVYNYVLVDANGTIVNATREASATALPTGIVGLNIKNREYFRRQAEATADNLIIGEPLKLQVSRLPAIVLTRRITGPDGKFNGIVAALINPIELGRTASGINLGSNGSFGLIGLDGVVRARTVNGVFDARSVGQKLPLSSGLLGHVESARTGHFWNTPGLLDDVERMVSYRKLDPYEVVAAVTKTKSEVYRYAYQQERIYCLIALLLTVAILIAVRRGVLRERKLLAATSEMLRAQEELSQSQERYAGVEAAVNDGIWDWNILTGYEYRSPRWKGIIGYAGDELGDDIADFRNLLHPDDKARVEEALRAHLEEEKPYDQEYRLRHKNGGYRWVLSRGKAVRDAENRPVRMLGSITDISERKAVETTLEENRVNLERAETMVGLGHYKYEKGAATITWSSGTYRTFAKSPDSFTPTPESVVALFHPDDRPLLLQHRKTALEGRIPKTLTARIVKDDGTTAFIQSWSTPIQTADGTVTGYFGTSQDVTEHRRAEIELKESRDNLKRAEAMVHMGHFKYDIASGVYMWSDGLYRIMEETPGGYTPTLESTYDFVHPDDRPLLQRYRADVLAGLSRAPVIMRAIRRNGSTMIAEVWSAPIRADDGTITGMFGTTRDVTARKQAEALVAESYRNLERAERLAQLGHYKIDGATGELIWSDGIFRIFGHSPATFTPTLRSALELIHPDDRIMLKHFRDEAMSGREVPHATLRAVKNDGSPIDIEYWSMPVRDSSGEITGIFGTLQDVTLRKSAEAALARANHELEARVSERTAELAEEMRRREQAQSTLAHMQKMEVVGQLTAGIAHDFNNLLAVIGGSLEFVDGAAARGLTADPELIDAALRATRRGRELVQRLLAFARQSPLRAEPTAIDQLVLDTLRLLRRTLGQGIDMVTHLDAKAAVISVDRNQMANALLNLALNARDAMPDGGQLKIATRVRPAASPIGTSDRATGDEVCIVISDTGVGMTEEIRKRAFEPFFTTKPDGLGSGLGLSMVQGFVEQSGGHIEIESGDDGGTTFTITLPRIASVSRDDESDAVDGMAAAGREKTVLLVEDDPDVRVVTAAQLKQLGYKVHAVTDGLEAIDLIASPATIDITLTDIVLPGGLDGVELIKEAMRARPNMGVLCMSGYDPTQKHRKWLQIQNIKFLEKPFSSNRLAQALHDALVL